MKKLLDSMDLSKRILLVGRFSDDLANQYGFDTVLCLFHLVLSSFHCFKQSTIAVEPAAMYVVGCCNQIISSFFFFFFPLSSAENLFG